MHQKSSSQQEKDGIHHHISKGNEIQDKFWFMPNCYLILHKDDYRIFSLKELYGMISLLTRPWDS